MESQDGRNGDGGENLGDSNLTSTMQGSRDSTTDEQSRGVEEMLERTRSETMNDHEPEASTEDSPVTDEDVGENGTTEDMNDNFDNSDSNSVVQVDASGETEDAFSNAMEDNVNTTPSTSEDLAASVDTFLEFTGSTDRDLAMQYLLASDGKIEHAVNEYLSGAQPGDFFVLQAAQAQLQNMALNESPSVAALLGGSNAPNRSAGDDNEGQVPNLLHAHLNALVHRSGLNPDNASEARRNTERAAGDPSSSLLGALFRTHASLGGSTVSQTQAPSSDRSRRGGRNRNVDASVHQGAALALRQLASGMASLSSSRIHAVADLLNRSRIAFDDPERVAAQIEAFGSGQWDKAPEIGAACLRTVNVSNIFLKLGLGGTIVDTLPQSVRAGEDGLAIRILQLVEAIIRIVMDGHGEAAQYCRWWFIPPRRSSSKKYGRSTLLDAFMEKVLPSSNVASLEQLWYNESFDPSWRDKKTEAEMLATSLQQACSIEFLDFLVDPVNGCRANVNPEPDRLGQLPSPLMIAAMAQNVKLDTDTIDPVLDTVHVDDRAEGEKETDDKDISTKQSVTSNARSQTTADSTIKRRSISKRFRRSKRTGDRTKTDQEQNTVSENDAEKLNKIREEWSRKAVEILLDAGASVEGIEEASQRESSEEKNVFTKSAQELIRQQRNGTRVSTRQLKKQESVGAIEESVMEKFMDETVPKLFMSLLVTIGMSRSEHTVHRAMEVLVILVERLRLGKNRELASVLSQSSMVYTKLLQMLQAAFANENDDLIALQIAAKLVEALLSSSNGNRTYNADSDFTQVTRDGCQISGTDSQDKPNSKSEIKQNGLDSISDSRVLFDSLCLNFCRFGITSRMMDLSSLEIASHQSDAVSQNDEQGEIDKQIEMNVKNTLRNDIKNLTSRLLSVIRHCITKDLKLSDETLCGKSPVLISVCRRLKEGDDSALLGLVSIINQEHAAELKDSKLDPQNKPVIGGITSFEFERSGLVNALARFLLASDVEEGADEGADFASANKSNRIEIQKDRMQKFLAIMPPPVTTTETIIPSIEEETINMADELENNSDDEVEPSLDDVIESENQSGEAISQLSENIVESMESEPLTSATFVSNSESRDDLLELESDLTNLMSAVSFQFGFEKRDGDLRRARHRSGTFARSASPLLHILTGGRMMMPRSFGQSLETPMSSPGSALYRL